MSFRAHSTRIFSFLMLCGMLCSLGGCSTWVTGHFKDPEIQLLGVDLVKARLLEQQFVLHFRIDNPNGVSLPIRGLSYDVHLNDIKLAEGESERWFTVPAHGHEIFEIPVTTNLWRHMRSIVKLLEEPDQPIRYRLKGEAKTGLLFGRRVQLSRYGEIIPGEFIPE